MIQKKSVAWLFASALLATPASAAVTITFDDVSPNSRLDSYTSGGMVFTSLQGSTGGQVFFPPDSCDCNANIDPDGSSVVGDPLIMRVDGGGTFDLLGFTFGIRPLSLGDAPATGFIKLQFLYDGGLVETEQFDVTHFGPEPMTLSRTNLRRVAFLRGEIYADTATCSFCTHSGGSIGPFMFDDMVIDNITHSENPLEPPIFPPPPAVTGVPEPTSWMLTIAGFGYLGVRLRRLLRPGGLPRGAAAQASLNGRAPKEGVASTPGGHLRGHS